MNSKAVALGCFGLVAWLLLSGNNPQLPGLNSSPVPGSGLHVLVVEDRLQRRQLPPLQFDAIMSSDIDEIIRKVGGHKYVYDQHQDVSAKDDPWVKDAMKVPRKKLPWLVIDNDGNGTSEEFPGDPRAFKEKVQSFLK